MKVKTNSVYTFQPVGWDVFDPKASIAPGTKVRVVKLPGAPPPNTMNHAHVADPLTGEFLGLVCCNSLTR